MELASSLRLKKPAAKKHNKRKSLLGSAAKIKHVRAKLNAMEVKRVPDVFVTGHLPGGRTVRLNVAADAQALRSNTFEATTPEKFKEQMAKLLQRRA